MNKTVVKQTFIYVLTDGISRAISFLLLPFVSFYLVPEQLGIAANFDVLQNILMLLAGQAIVNAIPYFYYGKSKEEVATLVSMLLLIVLVLNVIFSVIIFLSFGLIEGYLKIGLGLQLLTIVSVITTLCSQADLILFRLEERPYVFSALQLFQCFTYFGLIILLVIDWRMEAVGRIFSSVISWFAAFVIHFILLLKRGYLAFRFDKKVIKDLLKFGLPLLPHSLSFWLKSGMDKVLITTYCGLAANGLYSMAMNIGAIYSIFRTAFSNAYTPYLQKRINAITSENEASEKKCLVKLSYELAVLFVLLYFILVAVCWFIIFYVLDVKYRDAYQFIPWILCALTINSFYTLVIEYPYAIKKTMGLGLITFTGSLIQLLLTYVLIRTIGLNGIKYSLVLGAFIIMVGVWIYSNKVYPMPWFTFFLKRKRK